MEKRLTVPNAEHITDTYIIEIDTTEFGKL